MGDDQHAATAPIAQVVDQPVHGQLAGEVHLLDRLVEHQQVGVAQERSGEQDAPELAAGEAAELAVGHRCGPHLVEGRGSGGAVSAPRHTQETTHRERQQLPRLESLGDIAHHDAGLVTDVSRVRLDEAEQRAHGGGLAGAVRPDQAHHLPAVDLDRDPVQDRAAAVAHHQVAARGEQRPGGGRPPAQGFCGGAVQCGHLPCSSTT